MLPGTITEQLGELHPVPTQIHPRQTVVAGGSHPQPQSTVMVPSVGKHSDEIHTRPTGRTCLGEPVFCSAQGRAEQQSVIMFLRDRQFLEKSIFLTGFTTQPPPQNPNAKCAPDPHSSSQHVRNPGTSPSALPWRCQETVLTVLEACRQARCSKAAQGSVQKSDLYAAHCGSRTACSKTEARRRSEIRR